MCGIMVLHLFYGFSEIVVPNTLIAIKEKKYIYIYESERNKMRSIKSIYNWLLEGVS